MECLSLGNIVSSTGQRQEAQQRRRPSSTRLVPLRLRRREQRPKYDYNDDESPKYDYNDYDDEDNRLLHFFVTCAPGLEPIVAAELRSPLIGAEDIRPGSCGVSFTGSSLSLAYRASIWLRCGVRVLHQIAKASLRLSSSDPIYDFVRNVIDWRSLLGSSPEDFRSFSVQSRVRDCSSISSSRMASIRAKDAICDEMRRSCDGKRPDPPQEAASADVPLFLSLYRDRAVLYRDLCGRSLHMRGYRDLMHKASLNEGIAAAMLTIAGCNPAIQEFGTHNRSSSDSARVLLDPMCGSGTILIEAALMAMNKAPGLMRQRWPFQAWHDFDESAWKECLASASAVAMEVPLDGQQLLGNDIHQGAIFLCERDAEKAGVRKHIGLSCSDCNHYIPAARPSMVMVNPPWGSRLPEDDSSLVATYRNLGLFLKRECSQADVYLLSGNSTLTQQMRMKADRKWPLVVGGIDCRLLHYYVLPAKEEQPSPQQHAPTKL